MLQNKTNKNNYKTMISIKYIFVAYNEGLDCEKSIRCQIEVTIL